MGRHGKRGRPDPTGSGRTARHGSGESNATQPAGSRRAQREWERASAIDQVQQDQESGQARGRHVAGEVRESGRPGGRDREVGGE